MSETYKPRRTIGISTGALFDMRFSEHILRTRGKEAFERHQIKHFTKPFKPGHAFNFIKAINAINDFRGTTDIDVVLISKNSTYAGLRAMQSCRELGVKFSGALFTSGRPVVPYLKSFRVDDFMTMNPQDAQDAYDIGIASCVVDSPLSNTPHETLAKIQKKEAKLKVSKSRKKPGSLKAEFNGECPRVELFFDGDRVLFGHESDDNYLKHGGEFFMRHEDENAHVEISDGPFIGLAKTAIDINATFPFGQEPFICSFVTARGGLAALRSLYTLAVAKNVRMNGILAWLGGGLMKDGKLVYKDIRKDEILSIAMKQSPYEKMFFDDSPATTKLTSPVMLTGLVPRPVGAAAISEQRPEAPQPPKP